MWTCCTFWFCATSVRLTDLGRRSLAPRRRTSVPPPPRSARRPLLAPPAPRSARRARLAPPAPRSAPPGAAGAAGPTLCPAGRGWRRWRRPPSFVTMDAKVILCDFAEVAGGKMFISGAGLALLASATPTPPFRVNVALAILGLIGLRDTDAQHKLTLEL